MKKGSKLSAQELDKLIKIKALKWKKFFMGKTKVRLDIVNMFYAMKYHPDESYAIVEGEKLPFTTEEINESYNLPNDPDAYHG